MDTFALKFNSSDAVNTALAEEFLRKNEIKQILNEETPNIPLSILHKRLARKLVENTELFCQLEYLANGASAHDVRNNLKLIELNLNFHNRNYINSRVLFSMQLFNNVPLAALGYVTMVSHEKVFHIHSTKQRAAAYLFTKLCHEAGLKCVSYDPVTSPAPCNDKWRPTECTGVITERSDLDSAVEAFLSSSTTCFWRLNRILVQENIYESFKKTVEWKCSLKGQSSTEIQNDLKTSCTEAYVYVDKCLLLDYAGEESADRTARPLVIYVEAYRTTKELLSLIAKYDHKYMSLWSSDAAEANEISYNVSSQLVWVNDFDNFDGPPVASQFFYSNCLPNPLLANIDDSDTKMEQVKLWQKYDRETRLNIIYEVLETYDDDVVLVAKIQDKILKLNNNKTIEISKNRVCVTINLPVGITSLPKACDNVDCFIDIIELFVNGNAVVITYVNDDFKPLLKVLKGAGVPAIFSSPNESLEEIQMSLYLYKTRVILSNFGTIFAN